MIEIRPLTGLSFETLAAAFNDAFSDYVIPAAHNAQDMGHLLRRRGFRPDLAVGAFDEGRLAGFVFNCLDGEDAYNSGTGVVISHRRQSIARRLMQRSIETLPAKRYILEVIETNDRAIALYRDLGFVERRRFQCWSYDPQKKVHVTEIANADVQALYRAADVEPSWQNSAASVARATNPHVFLGNEEGAAIVFPWSGDLPLLAIQPGARRHGFGTRLLDACATRADRPLRIVNIDDSNRGIEAFLEQAGASRTVRQLEMTLAL